MPAFGRLDAVDDRDHLHRMALAVGQVTRTDMHWITGPVLDQNGWPHCVAYSAKQFLQTTPRRTLGLEPNPTTMYHEAQRIDEWPGEDYAGTSVRAGAKVLQERGHISEYIWAFDVETVRGYVLMRGPVMLGTLWYDGMMQPDKNGWVYRTGNMVGGHAYLACGYSSKRNAFRCVNSWGLHWGQRGKFWLHRDELAALMQQGGEACSAIEKRV